MADLEHVDLTASNGPTIRRWRRGPADATAAVCFVHGATYGGRGAFDPDGYSWLSAVSDAGRAAYAVDVRGYGDSARPPEIDEPATANEPVVRAATAAADVEAALADVRDAHDTVHLVGYSWGSIICGVALTEREVHADSLVQYGPVFRPPESHRDRLSPGDPPTAYRRVSEADARQRWADQRPDGRLPDDAFDAFWDALASSGQRAGEGEILAPNGTLVDIQTAIDAPPYDAGAVDVPTLVVRGSLDTASARDDALGLYDALGDAADGYAEVAGGSHFLQFEPRRTVLYETVNGFHDRIERR